MDSLSFPAPTAPTPRPADAPPATAEAFALIDGRGRVVGASEGFSGCLGHALAPAALVGRSIERLLADVLARPDAIEAGLWLQEVRRSAGEGMLHRTPPLRLYATADTMLVLTGQCAVGARLFLKAERVPAPPPRRRPPPPPPPAPPPPPP
ncbi:hypothetical protein, partial [Caenispirillum bisanense]|uniref:hypothetical protein n=1 Tax=Caenispirillum bisanense TaxID=414052 RepID=UPI0031CF723C